MYINFHINFYNYIKQVFVCAFLLVSVLAISQRVVIKNGVNIQASYYNDGQVNIGWELMQSYPEIEAVRIEIEPYRILQAKSWIREAHDYGYQVIATYHDSQNLGTDSKQELIKAAEWWKENYRTLSSSGSIIINLMNEWGSHNISPLDYSDAYNDAIEIVRTVYPDVIIVDVPGFGQATKIAADAYPFFEDQNITYSVHIYTSAFNIEENRWLSHEDLSYLEATGVDCMVGEFCDASTGGADWCSIIDRCYENGWPLFGWAWNGDGNNMNMIEPHWRDDPLALTFRPTEFMEVITNKLIGIPCYSQPDEDCEDDLIGEKCDDKNEYTINDRYNEYCHCVGTFTSELESNTSQYNLIIYPNPVSSNQELSIELFNINVIGQINIINSLGKILMSKNISLNQNRISVETSQLSNGVYWASFQTDQKVYFTKAFVVN